MSKRNAVLLLVLISVVGALVGALVVRRSPPSESDAIVIPPMTEMSIRRQLFKLVQPVKLTNCTLERFGEPHDGGYPMCANLLASAKAGYSYGISGYDQWGCDISRRLNVPVHQYDCFNTTRPVCSGGRTEFHEECIGPATTTEDSRLFDTLERQFAKNGHAGLRLVVKMDVEGAEWESLLQAPERVLRQIDQLSIELHGVKDQRYIEVLKRLRQFFYVAHVHFNNHACQEDIAPFPAWAYEVLFVSKRLGVPDPAGRVTLPSPQDAPNQATAPDCQTVSGVAKR
jgi:hypothetical protein